MSDNQSATRPTRTPPKLTPGETSLVYLTVALLLAVGTLGLIASFQSVSARAAAWGFQTPQILPIAIDLAIPGFTIAHLLLIRMDMELTWVRAVPFGLTYVTIYLNIQAGTSTGARLAHGALPLIWVVCSEIAGHVYRVLIGAATGKRMERIRRSRFLLAPFTTGLMWRRMILWEETSYDKALARERDRLLARAGLREQYGRGWRRSAPIRDRALLRLGEHAPAPAPTPDLPTPTTTIAIEPAATHASPAPELPPAQSRPADSSATVSLVKSAPVGAPAADISATATAASPAAVQRQSQPPTADTTTDKTAASSAPTARQATSRAAATRKKSTRRSMTEWVDLAGPVFHAEFERLRRQPTGDEFAEAIRKAKLGTVSASTAKNIRAEILDRAPLPALD